MKICQIVDPGKECSYESLHKNFELTHTKINTFSLLNVSLTFLTLDLHRTSPEDVTVIFPHSSQ